MNGVDGGLLFSEAETKDHFEIVGVRGVTVQPVDDEDVVGADGGQGTCSGGVVEGDGNVALAIDGLDTGARVVGVSSVGDRGRMALGLVVENDEPVGVVEVSKREDSIVSHEHSRGCC